MAAAVSNMSPTHTVNELVPPFSADSWSHAVRQLHLAPGRGGSPPIENAGSEPRGKRPSGSLDTAPTTGGGTPPPRLLNVDKHRTVATAATRSEAHSLAAGGVPHCQFCMCALPNGSMAAAAEHNAVCDMRQLHCQLVDTETGQPCTAVIRGRSALQAHASNTCMLRTTRCPNAGCGKPVSLQSLHVHQLRCNAERGCCAHCLAPMPRCDKASHEYACRDALVACPLGCGRRFPRKDITAHLQTSWRLHAPSHLETRGLNPEHPLCVVQLLMTHLTALEHEVEQRTAPGLRPADIASRTRQTLDWLRDNHTSSNSHSETPGAFSHQRLQHGGAMHSRLSLVASNHSNPFASPTSVSFALEDEGDAESIAFESVHDLGTTALPRHVLCLDPSNLPVGGRGGGVTSTSASDVEFEVMSQLTTSVTAATTPLPMGSQLGTPRLRSLKPPHRQLPGDATTAAPPVGGIATEHSRGITSGDDVKQEGAIEALDATMPLLHTQAVAAQAPECHAEDNAPPAPVEEAPPAPLNVAPKGLEEIVRSDASEGDHVIRHSNHQDCEVCVVSTSTLTLDELKLHLLDCMDKHRAHLEQLLGDLPHSDATEDDIMRVEDGVDHSIHTLQQQLAEWDRRAASGMSSGQTDRTDLDNCWAHLDRLWFEWKHAVYSKLYLSVSTPDG